MRKLFRLKAIILGCALMLTLTTVSVQALEYNGPGSPAAASVSGSEADNISEFTTKIDLSNFYPNAVISKATFSFGQTTAASTGTIKVYDKYLLDNALSDSLLATITLAEVNSFSFDCTQNAKDWLSNATHNTGLVFKASSLTGSETINFANLNLKLEFTLPDTQKPSLITDPEVVKMNGGKFRITAQADESVTVVMEYGKTSNYGEKVEQPSLNKDISFTLESLQAGVTYHYRLVISDAASNTTTSKDFTFNAVEASITPTTMLLDYSLTLDLGLPSVTELQAELTEVSGTYAVKLTWDEVKVAGITGYRLLRKEVGAKNFEELTRINTGLTTYMDMQVSQAKSYQYQIRVMTSKTESPGTSSVEVIIPTEAPSSIDTKTEDSEKSALFMLGLGVAITTFVAYVLYKLFKKLRSLFQPKHKKSGLDNVFRDPDLEN